MTDDIADHYRPLFAGWAEKFICASLKSCSGASYDPTNDLHQMALMFLTKQADHLESLIWLGKRSDTTLVARSMIEGLAMLKWAAAQPDERAGRWKGFPYVHSWRQIRCKRREGEDIDPIVLSRTNDGMAKYDALLLRKGESAVDFESDAEDDPYCWDWRCGYRLSDVMNDVRAGDLREKLYRAYCEWHHWDPVGLALATSWGEAGARYVGVPPRRVAGAYAVGVQCVCETLEVVIQIMPHIDDGTCANLCRDYRMWAEREEKKLDAASDS